MDYQIWLCKGGYAKCVYSKVAIQRLLWNLCHPKGGYSRLAIQGQLFKGCYTYVAIKRNPWISKGGYPGSSQKPKEATVTKHVRF